MDNFFKKTARGFLTLIVWAICFSFTLLLLKTIFLGMTKGTILEISSFLLGGVVFYATLYTKQYHINRFIDYIDETYWKSNEELPQLDLFVPIEIDGDVYHDKY